jgi:hypothetical protein
MNPDYRDMLSAFSEAGVEYLLVGAYALSVHGIPRATGDMDLWVRPTGENAERTLKALRGFGAPLHSLAIADLTRPGTVFQVGVAPRRIDILTSIAGVSFESAWPSRKVIRIDGIEVSVIGREDFIRNKRALGRPKDLADIAALEGGPDGS